MKKVIVIPTLFALSTVSGLAQKKSPLQASYLNQFRNGGDSVGSVSIERMEARGGVPLIMNDDNLLAIGFRYALDRYDFDGTNADWGSVHHANLGFASRWKIYDQWLLANYGIVGVSAEEGSDKDNGFNFNIISVAEYKVNDRLTIGPGVGISSKIDQDISVFPIISVQWDINDEWTLGSGPSEVAAAGANVYVEYTPKALQEKWMFTTGFYYSGTTYKLASNAVTTDGSAEERLASVYAAASYTMDSGVKLSLIGGYHFFQSYGIFDDGGNELSKEILEDAPYVGITVGFDF